MFWESFSKKEWGEFEEFIQLHMEEHLDATIGNMSTESFHTDFIEELSAELLDEFIEMGYIEMESAMDADEDTRILSHMKYKHEIYELIETYAYSFFLCAGVPQRYTISFTVNTPLKHSHTQLSEQIRYLQSIQQAEQRSQEWYDQRNRLITASNLWKVFGTDSEYNQLIFEKCMGVKERSYSFSLENDVSDSHINVVKEYVNTASPMHWGVKYEPLTIMLYEEKHAVSVGSFGCIVHPKYPYIGASPDGIVVSPEEDSPLFGRMVEIKNIVNREITGSPSEAYWIQMQIQMETCDLDMCDFVETRFKEYDGEREFWEEEDPYKKRGVILYFLKSGGHDSTPQYQYMSLDIPLTKDDVSRWIQTTKSRMYESEKCILYETLYWYLDEYSCVLVERNRKWFEWAAPHICDTWNIILKERVDGYEHRNPKKRAEQMCAKRYNGTHDTSNIQVIHSLDSTTQYIRNFPPTQNICLIKLDENGNIC
jgi:putative phage-type endonuclease